MWSLFYQHPWLPSKRKIIIERKEAPLRLRNLALENQTALESGVNLSVINIQKSAIF